MMRFPGNNSNGKQWKPKCNSDTAGLMQQHSAHLVALTAAVEKKQKKVASQRPRIAEVEKQLGGKDDYIFNMRNTFAGSEFTGKACKPEFLAPFPPLAVVHATVKSSSTLQIAADNRLQNVPWWT